jgi:hypothetical protein
MSEPVAVTGVDKPGAGERQQRVGTVFAALLLELERIISSIASGRMRADTYQRIVDESRVSLTPEGAWLLGRLATSGTLEHARKP